MADHGEVANYVEFLPGFTNFVGTKPGDILENDDYRLTFSGVLLNGQKSATVSRGFECCYNWTDIMNIFLDALLHFNDIETSEELSMEELYCWLMCYQGWGLLSTLLPRKQHLEFMRSLREIKENWPEDEEYTEEKCWMMFCEDKQLEDLVPEFEVEINEVHFEEGTGRKKWINLRFVTDQWNLAVKFSVEKKMPDFNLVNIAAAAVSEHLDDKEKIQHLEIPVTLRSPVAKMMKDVRWISSFETFWN